MILGIDVTHRVVGVTWVTGVTQGTDVTGAGVTSGTGERVP